MGPVGTDPRWDNFTVLEHYLQSKFKLVYEYYYGLLVITNCTNVGKKLWK